MGQVIAFELDGLPVPWARAQRRGGRYFTDPRVALSQRTIALAARLAGAQPIDTACAVDLTFHYGERPRTTVAIEEIDEDGTRPRRPDLDNLVKNVLDALNGIAWTDDARVCVLDARKVVE